MVKLILSTQSFLAYLIVIIKVLENRFSYKKGRDKKRGCTNRNLRPKYKLTWHASPDQKIYSITQSLHPEAITFNNGPTAEDIFFKLYFTSYIVGPGI